MPVETTAEGQQLTDRLETEILKTNTGMKAEIKDILDQLRERIATLGDAEKIQLSDKIVEILKGTKISATNALSSLLPAPAKPAAAQAEIADEQALLQKLLIPLDQLDFKVSKSTGIRAKALYALKQLAEISPVRRIQYVGDIAEIPPKEIYIRTNRVGKKTTELIQEALAALGVQMGTKLDPKVKRAFERKTKKSQWMNGAYTVRQQNGSTGAEQH